MGISRLHYGQHCILPLYGYISYVLCSLLQGCKIPVTHLNRHHQTAILSVFYLTAVGFVMVLEGIFINGSDNNPDYTNILFAGGFLTTVFWVCYIPITRGSTYHGNIKPQDFRTVTS